MSPSAANTTVAIWTPSTEAPEGLLTNLEAQRHDFFIELARHASSCPGAPLREKCAPGGIDVVFFGQTFSEMWWWPDRGMPVWEQAFRARKAVNFGSQGTRPESLLWRMRNGELDGYRAKLVVLQTLEPNPSMSPAESTASYAPIIAEIRARQPQAKILVFNIPRAGQQVADVNARAGAGIVEDGTVFYAGLSQQLVPGKSGYEAWAAELEPWLDRFAS
jgi:hypothetical protein